MLLIYIRFSWNKCYNFTITLKCNWFDIEVNLKAVICMAFNVLMSAQTELSTGVFGVRSLRTTLVHNEAMLYFVN